jgi:predicted acetyltransferase
MKYFIKPAEIKDKATIKDLLQPYLDELSHFPDENPDYKDENGIYLYPYLDAYWKDNTRFPYLFYDGENLTGFALVRKASEYWEMSEFYVKPEYRRRNLGITCATLLFRKHPGIWRISFNKANINSRNLWTKLANNIATGQVDAGETDASHDYIRFSVK